MKLSPIQIAALHGLRQHAPHGVPPARMAQYYRGKLYTPIKINSACAGLARRSPALVNSYTEGGMRRFQITDAGERALAEAEGQG